MDAHNYIMIVSSIARGVVTTQYTIVVGAILDGWWKDVKVRA